jgi:hypothetical protein
MRKTDLFQRFRKLLHEMKRTHGNARYLGRELGNLEYDTKKIEIELADMIDNYMAGQYAAYNKRQVGYGRNFESHTRQSDVE